MYTEINIDKKEVSPAILFKTVGKPQNAPYKNGALVAFFWIEFTFWYNLPEMGMRLRRPSGKGCRPEMELRCQGGKDCRLEMELCRPSGKDCRQEMELCRPSGKECRQEMELRRSSGKGCRLEMELRRPSGKGCRPSRESQISAEIMLKRRVIYTHN